MLNALMGKEILGSAVVPETANLTIVKYDTKSSAKVFFWNTKEWNTIVRSANELESIAVFVEETQKIFKEEKECIGLLVGALPSGGRSGRLLPGLTKLAARPLGRCAAAAAVALTTGAGAMRIPAESIDFGPQPQVEESRP